MGAYENPEIKVIDTRFAAANKALAEGTKTTIAAIQNIQKQQAAVNKLKADNANKLIEKANKLGGAFDKQTQDAFNLIVDIKSTLPAEQQAAMNQNFLDAFSHARQIVIDAGKSTDPTINANDVLKEQVLVVQSLVKDMNALSQVSSGAYKAEQNLMSDDKGDDALFLGAADYQTVLGAFGDPGTSDLWGRIGFVPNPTNPKAKDEGDYIIFTDTNKDDEFTQDITFNGQTIKGDQIIKMRDLTKIYEEGKGNKSYYETLGDPTKSHKLIKERAIDDDGGISSARFRITGTKFETQGGQQLTIKVDQPDYIAINNDLWQENGMFGTQQSQDYGSSISKEIDDAIRFYSGSNDLEKGVKKYVQKFYGSSEETGLGKYLNDLAKARNVNEINAINKFWHTAVKNELIRKDVLPHIKGFNTNTTSRILRQPSYSATDNKTASENIKALATTDINTINSFFKSSPYTTQEVDELAKNLERTILNGAYGTSSAERGNVSTVVSGQWKLKPDGTWVKPDPSTLSNTLTIVIDGGSKAKSHVKYIDLNDSEEAKRQIMKGHLAPQYPTSVDYIDYILQHPYTDSNSKIAFDDSGYQGKVVRRSGATGYSGTTGQVTPAGGSVTTGNNAPLYPGAPTLPNI